jgi:uncharacterized membrane protein YbhN (UPF0104 family)
LAADRSRRSWRTAIRLAVLLALLAFVALALVDRWQEVRPVLTRLSPWAVTGAMTAVLASLFCSFLAWRAALAGLGSRLPLRAAMRVFFLGQLGKYVPGSVWPLVAQTELGRQYGVPRRSSGAALVIATLTVLASGLAVAAAGLPLLGSDAYARYTWTLLVLPVALVALWPPVLNRLIALALRLTRREPMPVRLTLDAVARVTGWSLAAWGLLGVHLWILALSIGAGGRVPGLLEATAAFAGAWCIGFLLIIAPAGAGAREAALVFLLHPVMPATAAAVVALTSRLVATAADVVWGLVALGAERNRRNRRNRRAPRERPAGPDDAAPEPVPQVGSGNKRKLHR